MSWSASSYHFGTPWRRAKSRTFSPFLLMTATSFDPAILFIAGALFTSHTSPAPMIPQCISASFIGSLGLYNLVAILVSNVLNPVYFHRVVAVDGSFIKCHSI